MAGRYRAGRVGHLFQGRFDARLIDKEAYFLEVCRYIVLNPVRAGLVKHPQDWNWSSYAATAGLADAPKWLAINEILRAFGPTVEDARLEYASYVARGVESSGERLESGRPLWLEDTQRLIDSQDRSIEHPSREIHVGRPDMSSVFEAVARTFHVRESDCRKGRGGFVRSVAAYLAFHDATLRLVDIAEALNLTNPSSVSRLVARCETEIANSEALREMVARFRTRFTRGQVLIFAFGDGGKAKIKT